MKIKIIDDIKQKKANIIKKRELFYNNIIGQGTADGKPVQFWGWEEGDMKDFELNKVKPDNYIKYLKIILKLVNKNSEKLIKCVDRYYQYKISSKGKPEGASKKYLEEIRKSAEYVRKISVMEKKEEKFFADKRCSSILIGIFSKELKNLQNACFRAGTAKFSRLTFGAVLDYKPIRQKFIDLSEEIVKLSKGLAKMLEALPLTHLLPPHNK